VGLVPASRIGLLFLANRGEFSHEVGRYHILPAPARQSLELQPRSTQRLNASASASRAFGRGELDM
jgi:hypothetical protein